MRVAHQTNTRGVAGHPAGVTSIKDLFYLANGETEAAIREIADAGYAGVELFDGDLLEFPGGSSALARLLREVKLQLVAVYAGANLIFPEILGEELSRVERAAETAAALSAEHLVIGGGARRSTGAREQDYELLGAALDRVVEIAERHGLLASFHPHLGTCVEAPAEIDRAFARTGIGFCPDTAHLAAGGSDNLQLIETYADRIRYVHIKDYLSSPLGFVPLGEGELDVAAILRALEAIGYDGWLTVETDGYLGDPAMAALTSKRFLESLHSDIAR